MRISMQQRKQNEARIRTVMDRFLQGDIPPGGKCDVKTLARETGVDRAAFYGTRPYARLREEFETRLQALHQIGDAPDPRDAQITRLKDEIATLKQRLAARDQTISELRDFRIQALSRLAAQHDEIIRLRRPAAGTTNIRHLPSTSATAGPCS